MKYYLTFPAGQQDLAVSCGRMAKYEIGGVHIGPQYHFWGMGQTK